MSHLPLSWDLPGARGRSVHAQSEAHTRLAGGITSYLAVTDPRSVLLLVFTALAAGVIAGGLRSIGQLVLIALALALACMGARAVANYVDRDIDALMERTRRRPLPRGALQPSRVLTLGLVLISAGMVIALSFGPVVALLVALGLVDNLVVYSLLTKRTSPWSIVLGAPSGGAPAFVGYVAIAGRIDATAVLLAVFVMLWTPIHIWSLAIRSQDDYARAGVPMLPVVAGVRRSAKYIGYASAALAVSSVLFLLIDGSGVAAPVSVAVLFLAAGLLLGSLWLVRAPTAANAWRLFKLTSPYLAVLFALLAVNAVISGW